MKFCPHCGAELLYGDQKFCNSCGGSLEGVLPTVAEKAASEPQPSMVESETIAEEEATEPAVEESIQVAESVVEERVIQAAASASGVKGLDAEHPREKMLAAVMIGLAGALGYVLIPFLPLAVAFALAVILGLLALRTLYAAVFATLMILSTSLAYQFGAIAGNWTGLYVLAGYTGLSIYITIRSLDHEKAVGAALGVIAAAFMLTPYYTAAVPLIIFFTTTYRRTRISEPIMTYLMYCIPVHILSMATSQVKLGYGALPAIYSQAAAVFYRRVEVLSFGEIVAPIINMGEPYSGSFDRTVFWLIQYLVKSYSIITLTVIIFASFSAALMFERLMASLKEKGFELKKLQQLIPLASNFLGCIVFAVPIIGLSGPLGYTTFGGEGLLSYAAIAFAGSSITALVRARLGEMERMMSLRDRLRAEVDRLLREISVLEERVARVKELCRGIMIEDLSAEIDGAKSGLSVTATTLESLHLGELEDRVTKLGENDQLLKSISSHLHRRLVDHFSDTIAGLDSALQKAATHGVKFDRTLGVDTKGLSEWSFESLIEAEQVLERDAEVLVKHVVNVCQDVYGLVKRGIDPSFTLTGVDIARRFLEQKDLVGAAQAANEAVEAMGNRFGSMAGETAGAIQNRAGFLEGVIRRRVEPLIEKYELEGLAGLPQFINEVNELAGSVVSKPTIIDMITLDRHKDRLLKLFEDVLESIRRVLKRLEDEVDRRVPARFSWGKNLQIHESVELVIRELREASGIFGSAPLDAWSKASKILSEELELLDRYLLDLEFIVNYPNVDSLLKFKLRDKGEVQADELTFNLAERYMRLYSIYHQDASYDPEKKLLTQQALKRSWRSS